MLNLMDTISQLKYGTQQYFIILLCSVYAHDWIWLVGGRYGVLLPTRSSYN